MTKEEIARAKELDLLTYFKLVEPGNLKLVGKEYRHKVHSSLTISKDSLWCWHCIGLRGRTALKYLIDVEKVPYVEAVREINRIQGGVVHSSQPVSLPQPRAEPEAPRDFKLPKPDANSYAAMAYLRGRCIHPNVLAFCRKEGILYQTSFKNHPNCVFVGRDGEGVAKGGSLRGCTQLQFRRDIAHAAYRAVAKRPLSGAGRYGLCGAGCILEVFPGCLQNRPLSGQRQRRADPNAGYYCAPCGQRQSRGGPPAADGQGLQRHTGAVHAGVPRTLHQHG